MLTSTRSSEEMTTELAAVNVMDVVLDACWAVVSEIDLMDGPLPDSLKSFADKRIYHLSFQQADRLDGDMIRKIGEIRCPKERYDIIEKIGKGAYGNVPFD